MTNNSYQIEKVSGNKKDHLELLLLADPDESMLDHYLERGEMFVLRVSDEVIAEAVICPTGDPDCCELKNLAVSEEHQRKGYATALVDWCCDHYAERYRRMQVGTAETGIVIYEKMGFRYSHTLPGFFTENYTEPIYDQGVLCRDMFYFVREVVREANLSESISNSKAECELESFLPNRS